MFPELKLISTRSTTRNRLPTALLLSLVVCTSALAGCFGSDDDDDVEPGWQWPEKADYGCAINNTSGLICEPYGYFESTPILTIDNPVDDSIWVLTLDGVITKFSGDSSVNHLNNSTSSIVGDLSSVVSRCHNEQGLLGMTFTEEYALNGRIMLVYTENNTCASAKDSNVVLAHATIVDDKLDMDSLEVLIEVEKESRNHNGGNVLSIGNNQYIWSLGDGGGSFDPYENGQNRSTKLGTIQLIHYVDGEVIPPENDSNENSETLHYGLRNPYRMDVDPNGNLWIADVGQLCYEEVNMVPVLLSSNFGWSEREGFHDLSADECYENTSAPNIEFTDPVIEYSHEFHCSIIGGFWMDWGPEALQDGYIYGDFCSGMVWKATGVDGNWTSQEIGALGTMIVGFGKGINNELLVFSWTGQVYQLNEI